MDVPEFKRNVAREDRCVLGHRCGGGLQEGMRENIDEWNKVGSDYPYHYLGSAKTMCKIGQAFGEAVLELRGETK